MQKLTGWSLIEASCWNGLRVFSEIWIESSLIYTVEINYHVGDFLFRKKIQFPQDNGKSLAVAY